MTSRQEYETTRWVIGELGIDADYACRCVFSSTDMVSTCIMIMLVKSGSGMDAYESGPLQSICL